MKPNLFLCLVGFLLVVGGGQVVSSSQQHDDHCGVNDPNCFVHKSQQFSKELFAALNHDPNQPGVSSKFFVGLLNRTGLGRSDPRLAHFFKVLDSLGAIENDVYLTFEQFLDAIHSSKLVHDAVKGNLRVPDFEELSRILTEVYEEVEPNKDGANAAYIPQLAEVDPEQFSISVTTVDGQQFSIGPSDTQFCIQSCSKVISYLIALTQFGAEYVHKSVSTEPSGHAFNDMVLKAAPTPENPNRKIPHNPMINAGAMMTMSMVFPEFHRDERHSKVLEVWKQLSGGDAAPIGYDEKTYESESATADRNWCLAYMMKHDDAFPPCFTNLSDTLELYFQICSTLSTNKAMAMMAATLANGGLNPVTGVRVFSATHVSRVLPIMAMAGLYDFSGQWAYDVGLPAKSGVGGCIFLVIPNVGGVSVWSPRLDSYGNSVRGIAVARSLVKRLAIHSYEVFSGSMRSKFEPTERRAAATHRTRADALVAASEGDTGALQLQLASGVDLYAGDYDNRTVLHLAASEGHVDTVKFLVLHTPSIAALSTPDRWGGTPLGDAENNGNSKVAHVLIVAGAKRNEKAEYAHVSDVDDDDHITSTTKDTVKLIYAAAVGNLDFLVAASASGSDLTQSDYDKRTPLHLAASNGHTEIVRYLIAQYRSKNTNTATRDLETSSAMFEAKDRWGNRAIDDASREGHTAIQALLKQFSISNK